MPHESLCYCSQRLVNVNDASFVVTLYGITTPLCSSHCYRRYLEKEETKAMRRREEAARMTTCPDDRIGEVYGRNARYADI